MYVHGILCVFGLIQIYLVELIYNKFLADQVYI